MNRGTYTAANGMIAQQRRLEVVSNNLANVNTRGFKSDRLSFDDMLERTMADASGYGEVVGTMSSGPEAIKNVTNFAAGAAEATGNPLDLMMKGDGMFAVGTPQGVRYTRDGSFTLNKGGNLVTKAGYPVLDESGRAITGITSKATIKADGEVRVDGRAVATVGRFRGTFTKAAEGGTLFGSTNAKNDPTQEVESGMVETSNVNPVLEMVDMIALQRTYEIAQKMIQSQDESTGKLNEAIA